MLKVILNRLKPKAEEIIAEGQAGFRTISSLIKKSLDREWYADLWATLRKYNISAYGAAL